MIISFDHGRFWHEDCIQGFSAIMREERNEPENKRGLIKCLHCGKQGYLPHGSGACTKVEEVTE